MSQWIYLDHNATTPPLPEVVQEVADCMTHTWGNASSTHAIGQEAKQKSAASRGALAKLLGCKPAEIIFTSGATEANHIALLGAQKLIEAEGPGGRTRIVMSAVEHAGVQKLAKAMADHVRIDFITVLPDGMLDMAAAKALIGPDVALVSVMAANNETGVVMPIAQIAELAHACGARLHVDATQLLGKLPFDFNKSGADLVSVSAHKLHGPKGMGALLLKQGVAWPVLFAGSQERGRRGGTENLPGIAGFVKAAQSVLTAALPSVAERVAALRDRLQQGLQSALPGTVVWAADAPRLPNTLYLRFGLLEADLVLNRLERVGVIASSGSACSAGGSEPSLVLTAMGVPRDEALCAIRLSLADTTTDDEIERVIEGVSDELLPLLNEQQALAESALVAST